MKTVLTVAFLTLLCTCVSAQKNLAKLPRNACSVALIKGKTGYLIDSVSLRTTLDTVPYGFSFPGDTLFLDVSIYDPIDELTLETFAGTHSFGRRSCWVDAPSADVYLSVQAGRTVVDSVGLSPVDRLFRQELDKINAQTSPKSIKFFVLATMNLFFDTPIAADFQAAYLDMITLNRADLRALALNLEERTPPAKRHPRFTDPDKKFRLMNSRLPGRLSRYTLRDTAGRIAILDTPKDKYYILNLYNSTRPSSRRNHRMIAATLAADSLFAGIPIISVSNEPSPEEWSAYVREGAFGWPHYHEPELARKKRSEKMMLYPEGTYLLINKDNLIEAVCSDLQLLASALVWRRGKGML